MVVSWSPSTTPPADPSRRPEDPLEIGTGPGHDAALLAHPAGAAGRVITVEIDADVADAACAHLAVAGADTEEVVYGDGHDGYPKLLLTTGSP